MFKKRLIGFVLLILCLNIFFSSHAQNSWQPQTYNGVSKSYKSILFSEKFDNNLNQWNLKSNKGNELKIEGGFLELQSEDEKITTSAEIEINENENFEIDTKLGFLSGNQSRAYGLHWGKSDEGDRYFSFVINAKGQYAISKFSGAHISYKQESAPQIVKLKDFNRLIIRKVDNMVYFFINEELVYSMEYKLSYGNLIGFQSGGGNAIQIDYLEIYKLNYQQINNPPQIIIKEPVLEKTFVEVDENTKTIEIYGSVKDEEPVNSIEINGKTYPVRKNGSFSADLDLKPGLTSIKLSVTDNQLQIGEEYINIRFLKNNNPVKEKPKLEIDGNYYALIIAVNDYKNPGFPDLDGPIPDAERLKKILVDFYSFDDKNVTLLENPDRDDFIVALDNISEAIREEDNLLIFYAGHGYWEDDKQLGYWVPSDASWESKANWFRNSTLKSYIASINTKHILLISDACFAGGIFKSRGLYKNVPEYIAEKSSLPSRKAMTSGNLQEVPDKSEFIKYLTSKLIDNKEKFITAESIFNSFQKTVKQLTNIDPQYGTIGNSGDQGGDFIFIRK